MSPVVLGICIVQQAEWDGIQSSQSMILVAYLLLLLKLRKGEVIHPLVVQEFYLSYFIINMSPHLNLNDKSAKQF